LQTPRKWGKGHILVGDDYEVKEKNIDIADILGSDISVNIDIDKGDIDPAL